LTRFRLFAALGGLLLGNCAERRPVPAVTPASTTVLNLELFSIDPSSVAAGQSVVIRWKVKGAEKISIKPLGDVPSEGTRRIQIDADAGRLEFVLSATGAGLTKSRTAVLSVRATPLDH
jgi:hypothetical protein